LAATDRSAGPAATGARGGNTAAIGFEEKIWTAADILRGNMDAAEYKHVVLGLIFLKYISDKFEERYRQLKAEDDDVEDKDAYAEVNVFFVPPSARWRVIAKAAHEEKIGMVIDGAMRALEKENRRLKDILPKNYARDELDKRRLGNVVDLFTNIKMVEHGADKDILGRTYEYCLSKFAEQEGRRAGEFYTPSCVVRTLVEVLQPFKGRVYDPCCGSGGMFVQSSDFVKNHSGNIGNLSVYGQDANPTTRKMALMNLAIRGIEANLGAYNADTFHNDLHPTLKADFILANPPFNLSDWNDGSLNDDVRWKYGLPPNGNANFAWLQHMIFHLSPNGKIGMVLANGSLSSQSGGEGAIRRKIVEDDLVEGIIAMPTQLFYTTQIPVSLWFISRNKKQKGKTLFIDARKMGTMVNRRLRELTYKNDDGSDGDILKIAHTFQSFQKGRLEDVKGYCAVAATAEIARQDYILTPGRYVGIEEREDNGEPFEEKMARLTGELSELWKKSHELEDEIRRRLGALGFEIE
jgi:type I restriction enzyme M protein